MELSLEEAHALVVKVMKNFEQNEEYANIIADHIIDCELRGLSYGGLARILSVTERLQRTGNPVNFVEVVHETPTSARLRGHDNLGYVVGYKATELAITKAKESGIAIVAMRPCTRACCLILLKCRGYGFNHSIQLYCVGCST